MAKLISAKDIEAAAAAGNRSVTFEPGAIITPAAKDRARELGVTIGSGTNGHTAYAGPAQAALSAPAGRGQFLPVQAPPASPAPPIAPPAPVDDRDNPTYFSSPVIDNLFNISLELGAAIWVVKDRLRVLEDLLSQKGVVREDEIERYRASADKERENRAKRDMFIEKIYKSIRDNPG